MLSEIEQKLDELREVIQENYADAFPGKLITEVMVFIGGDNVFYTKIETRTPEELAESRNLTFTNPNQNEGD